jgi:hypothetical protein
LDEVRVGRDSSRDFSRAKGIEEGDVLSENGAQVLDPDLLHDVVAGVDETNSGKVDGCELSDGQVDKVDDVLCELMVEMRVGDLPADNVLKR